MTATATTFSSLDPRTGDVVGTYPVHDAAAVDAAVARAVEAARWWADLGFDGRARRLREWKKALVRGLDRLARTIADETGKPFDDARLEMVLADRPPRLGRPARARRPSGGGGCRPGS